MLITACNKHYRETHAPIPGTCANFLPIPLSWHPFAFKTHSILNHMRQIYSNVSFYLICGALHNDQKACMFVKEEINYF